MSPVQMLWIGARLSNLERLSMASFVANGHPVHLYSYGGVENVPAGVVAFDAREILPESSVFAYADGFGRGSPAAFANRFRYKLLLERGGMYADADIVCLRPFEFAEAMEHAIASERIPQADGQVRLNACFLKAPAGSDAMRACSDECATRDPASLRWGETGPELVTRVFGERGMRRFALAPEVINPVDWWDAHRLALLPLPQGPASTHAVHFWNELWRQQRLDKDATYAPDCAFETLKRRYGV